MFFSPENGVFKACALSLEFYLRNHLDRRQNGSIDRYALGTVNRDVLTLAGVSFSRNEVLLDGKVL